MVPSERLSAAAEELIKAAALESPTNSPGGMTDEATLRSGDVLTGDRVERWNYCPLKTISNTPAWRREILSASPISGSSLWSDDETNI